MNILNIYKVEPGKPMIYNMESARSFLQQSKNIVKIRLCNVNPKGSFLEVGEGKVRVGFTQYAGDLGIDFESSSAQGEEAVKLLWKYRKSINLHFNR